MVDLEHLKRAISIWQLVQVSTYFRQCGDNWCASVLRICADRLAKRFANDIGASELRASMERVLAFAEDEERKIQNASGSRRLH